MTKVGILDDEVVICETLTKYLLELGYDVIDYSLNYDEAVETTAKNIPDIYLIDINLGKGKSGIDFSEFLRENYTIPLIFISSYSDQETLSNVQKVKPNGYLVKPFNKNDLFASIEVALSNFSKNNEASISTNDIKWLSDAFFIKQDSTYIKIYFKNLIYIKSDGVYLELITEHKKYLIRETLKNCIQFLPQNQFFQIHRSYIINLSCIDSVGVEEITISTIHLPLSKIYRNELLQKLNLL